ncbi:MAG: gamma-glutamyl-gamma-aminobutyrate hydrolase family protein [Pyrinomonadaceae bacterium]|nr:gamma-glutamyl-gamma-aminobutyrate hydrolase family protein [Blastocatellia bacterium]
MAYRPQVGITMRLELETRRFYLGRDYSEAIEAAGAIPIHLALIPKRDYIEGVLRNLDGVLLPGSDSDVDPSYYGEEPHPKLKRVVPEKDETDLLVLAIAEELGLPVLGICFGMQSLNVSRGGSLVQDIESHIEKCVKHEQGAPTARNSHLVKHATDSLLASIAVSAGVDKLKVNSHHHQSISRVGENLAATAWANDGVIECIEDTREDRYVFGVQWHPELSWQSDCVSSEIFTKFIEGCVKHANDAVKRSTTAG